MSNFVWYDLMTDDCKAAAAFYEYVVGWQAADSGMLGPEYTIFSMGTRMIGGLMPIPAESLANGAEPCWSGYVGVDDVDAYVARVSDAGGSVHRPAEEIPGVGRFAVVADPHGAAFILFTPNRDGQPSDDMPSPGSVSWRELHAGDSMKDLEFYNALFGWIALETHDMGPMGQYVLFGNEGSAPVGGMITKMADTPKPYWLYYFLVDGIDAAVTRVKERGGKVWNEPVEVPGGSWVASFDDPSGASFALMSPKR